MYEGWIGRFITFANYVNKNREKWSENLEVLPGIEPGNPWMQGYDACQYAGTEEPNFQNAGGWDGKSLNTSQLSPN